MQCATPILYRSDEDFILGKIITKGCRYYKARQLHKKAWTFSRFLLSIVSVFYAFMKGFLCKGYHSDCCKQISEKKTPRIFHVETVISTSFQRGIHV